MTIPRTRPRHNDSGAALLLAIGFVLMIGAISAGLAAAASSSLNNRATLQLLRDREYAADGKVEEAISWVQSHPLLALGCTSPAQSGSMPVGNLNNVAIRVDWLNVCSDVQTSDGTVVTQRNAVFTAFYCATQANGAACSFTAAPLELDVLIIRAEVNFAPASFDDVPYVPFTTYIRSWSVSK